MSHKPLNTLLAASLGMLLNAKVGYAQSQDAQAYYLENVDIIVQSKCRNCHMSGGQASYTPLLFTGSASGNHGVFKTYVNSPSPGARADRVLGKIRGALGHGGGIVISAGSANYKIFEQYLGYVDTSGSDPLVPGAPANVEAVAGDELAIISFLPPADDGGAEITRYTVISNPGAKQGRCSGSPCEVDDLSNGTAYTFTVTATNEVGEGPSSPISNEVTPAAPSVLRVSLEEPIKGATHMGIGNLRGWAVASDGVDKVEVLIDGAYVFDAPYGGNRTDVGGAFPDIEGSDQSGFSLAYNYSNLTAGEHTVTVIAHSSLGETKRSSSTFDVVRFAKSFMGSQNAVNFDAAQCDIGENSVSIVDATVDGSLYDFVMRWRVAEQGFEIVEIR